MFLCANMHLTCTPVHWMDGCLCLLWKIGRKLKKYRPQRIGLIITRVRLRKFGHVEHKGDNDGGIKRCVIWWLRELEWEIHPQQTWWDYVMIWWVSVCSARMLSIRMTGHGQALPYLTDGTHLVSEDPRCQFHSSVHRLCAIPRAHMTHLVTGALLLPCQVFETASQHACMTRTLLTTVSGVTLNLMHWTIVLTGYIGPLSLVR